jgi:hypothetical protein
MTTTTPTYASVHDDFIRLVDINNVGIANAFDDMVDDFVADPRQGLPTRLAAAEAMLMWATAESTGAVGSLTFAGYHLNRPGSVAVAMGNYFHARIWAALCGAAVQA